MAKLDRTVYIPGPMHPEAEAHAHELFSDVLKYDDPRAPRWFDYAEGIAMRVAKLTPDEVAKASKLKIVSRNGAGYDSVPVDICRERGIAVTNLPGFNSRSVAELALGLSIAVARKICALDRRIRAGETLKSIDFLSTTLQSKTVGIVGMGHIAYYYASKMKYAFDCDVLVYSPTSTPDKWTAADPNGLPALPHTRVASLDDLLRSADIVSLHCPLTDQTQHMIGAPQFKLMKNSAILINTGRGALIDEVALIEALKTNEIYGAGLDVMTIEPPTPEAYGVLYEMDNVIILPHVGGGTEEIQIESCKAAFDTVYAYLKGEGVGQSNRIV